MCRAGKLLGQPERAASPVPGRPSTRLLEAGTSKLDCRSCFDLINPPIRLSLQIRYHKSPCQTFFGDRCSYGGPIFILPHNILSQVCWGKIVLMSLRGDGVLGA